MIFAQVCRRFAQACAGHLEAPLATGRAFHGAGAGVCIVNHPEEARITPPTIALVRPATPKVVTLRTTEDLIAARDRRHGLRHQQVRLELAHLAPADAAATATPLTELLEECGCSAGARAMAAAGGLSLAGLAVLTGGPSLRLLALSPLALIGAIVGAGAGKAYGLARSRREFRRAVDALLNPNRSNHLEV